MFYRSAGKRSARSNASAASSAPLSRQHTATYRSETSQNIQTTRIPCPIALRQRILGLDQMSCRCSRHYIPQIMDIEYNEFIQIEAPDGQLIVISVVSSLQVALPTFLYWLLWNTFLCKPSTNISLYYGWMSTPIHTKNLNFGTYILQVNKFFFKFEFACWCFEWLFSSGFPTVVPLIKWLKKFTCLRIGTGLNLVSRVGWTCSGFSSMISTQRLKGQTTHSLCY